MDLQIEVKKMGDFKKRRYIWAKPVLSIVILGIILLFTGAAIADGNDDHMGGGGMMGMNWWGSPIMWFWMIGYWVVFVIIGILVYKDAEKRGMSGLLWFILVILPWIGILFLIIYLIVREDKTTPNAQYKSANVLLDERYARGEITREDYLRMKKDISG
ncbi:MAG: SHOCT domain-containing protein [Methanomassiliicoccales archaeon]|nr:MAG: SHOCT domain-containing protein [Methanomassiliicoccales archaeon]